MNLYIAIESPHRWITLNSKGEFKESGVIDNLENYRVPKSVENIIGVAPGEAVACHSVHIPGKNKRNAESALGFALEERLTDEIENLHFKLLFWDVDGMASVAVVSKEQLTSWVKKFHFNDINIDQIVAEYFLLPHHSKGDVTIANSTDFYSDNKKFFIRKSKYSGLSLDFDGFQYWWETQGSSNNTVSITNLELAKGLREGSENKEEEKNTLPQINHWNIGDDFTQWLSKSPLRDDLSRFNLLDGSFSPTHGSKSASILRVAALTGILGILIKMGSIFYESHVLESRKADLNQDMRALFSSYFPDQPYLDRPKSQVTNLISSARKGQSVDSVFQVLLRAVAKITPANGVTVDEASYRDKALTIICRVQNLSSLDTIIQAFNGLPDIRAELLSSGARDGVITGRIRIFEKG